MKAWQGVWVLLVFLGIASGKAAFALDTSPHAVTSQGTGTQTASEGPQVIVRVPLFSPLFEQVPLALVNEDPITMEDLATALGKAHEGPDATKKQFGKIDYGMFLDRLINVRLVAQEATTMGFDELAEFKSAMDEYSAEALARLLVKDVTKDVKETDPAAVEKLYKDRVVEWKIKSLLFEKEEDAKNMADAIKAGKGFDELAEKAITEKKAKTTREELNYIKPRDLAPDIQAAVATLQTGSVSPILRVQAGKTSGFTILKLEDRRYPENPEARKQAEMDVLYREKDKAWEKYKQTLMEKQVKIKEKVLNKLDLDSPKNDFEKMLKDDRVVAEIKGEKPVTVGELIAELEAIHYHGLKQAAESKKLNHDKLSVLNKLISKRLIEKVELEKGLAGSEEYKKGLKNYKAEMLFGLFMGRVVAPDVNLEETDLKAYYEDHKKEYLYPEMMKMSSLAFGNKRDAESALKMLKKGDDIKWVKTSAEGLIVKSDSDDDPLILNNSVLSTKTLPPAIAKVIPGGHAGDFRLYESEGRFYVLSIHEVIPSTYQPYEEVRAAILEKVYGEKLTRAMEDWFLKLRSSYPVKIYLSDIRK